MLASRERRNGALAPSGLAALGAVLVLLTAAAFRKVWGADFWWQWATGRLVAEHGIPQVDPFSYTMTGQPWIEMRWLYCWTLYRLTEVAGTGAAIVAKWSTLVASFALVTAPVFSRRTATVAAAVLTISVMASAQRFFVRPELVTYLMFGVYVWIIDRFRRRGGNEVFVLPVLQIVWTNSHTLFLFGPLLLGLLALVSWLRLIRPGAEREARAALRRAAVVSTVVFGLAAAACLLNPYGLRGAMFPFLLFGELRESAFKDAIREFWSPLSFGQGYPAVVYWEVLIGVCVASAVVNLRRLDPFWTVLVASQLYLAALAIRNLPLFSLAAVPFVLHNLRSSRLLKRAAQGNRLRGVERAAAGIVVVVALGTSWDLVTNRFHVRQSDTNQSGLGLAEHRFPEKAVRFLAERELPGRIFHTMREGAFLLAHGHRVFIDPRLEVYGERHFARYLSLAGGGPGWREGLREWDVRLALLDLPSPLAERMLADDGWRLVHFDETAALFASSATAFPDPIVTAADFERAIAGVRESLPGAAPDERPGILERVASPLPYKRVAEFLIAAGHPALALSFFRDVQVLHPDDVDAHRGVAWIQGHRGDADAATRTLEAALRQWPQDPWMLFQLGVHRFNAGRIDEADSLVAKSLAVDPDDPVVWSLRARIDASRGDHGRAAEALERALTLDPSNGEYRDRLGASRSLSGGAD